MALKFTCVICSKIIYNPFNGQQTCGDEKCREKYASYQRSIWHQNQKLFKQREIIKRMGDDKHGFIR